MWLYEVKYYIKTQRVLRRWPVNTGSALDRLTVIIFNMHLSLWKVDSLSFNITLMKTSFSDHFLYCMKWEAKSQVWLRRWKDIQHLFSVLLRDRAHVVMPSPLSQGHPHRRSGTASLHVERVRTMWSQGYHLVLSSSVLFFYSRKYPY